MAQHVVEDKPTKSQIEEELAHLQTQWSGAHAKWKKIDTYVDLEFQVWDKRYENRRSTYRPGTAPSIISHAVDVQMAFDPQISRVPVHDNETSKGHANTVEVALQGIQLNSFSGEMAIPPKELHKNMLTYGYGVIADELQHEVMTNKPVEPVRDDDETEEEFEARETLFKASKRNWNPVRWIIPHPTEVLINPMEREPSLAIRESTMEAQAVDDLIQRREGLGRVVDWVFSMTGKKRYTEVPVIERWTPTWHTLMEKQGNILYTEKNTWGKVPFQHGFSGFGRRPGKGSTKSFAEAMAVGILDPILDSLQKEAQNYSAKHQVLMAHAYRQMGTTGDATEVAEQMNEGQLLSEMEPESLWIADAPEVSNQLFAAGEEIRADIRGAVAGMAQGAKQPGVNTVGQQAILSTANQRFFAGVARQSEYMWSDAFGFALRIVDITGDEIGINGKMLRPREIEGNYKVVASFEQIDLALKIQQQEVAMSEFERKLISREEYYAITGRTNPTELRKGLLRDNIRDMPEIWAIEAREVAREDGMEQEFDEALEMREQSEGIEPTESIQDTTQGPNPSRSPVRNNNGAQTVGQPRVNIG